MSRYRAEARRGLPGIALIVVGLAVMLSGGAAIATSGPTVTLKWECFGDPQGVVDATGNGWTPGSSVDVSISVPGQPVFHNLHPDQNGYWFASWEPLPDGTFTVTATGSKDGTVTAKVTLSCEPSPSPTPSPTASPTSSPTPSPTPSVSPSVSPSATPTATPTPGGVGGGNTPTPTGSVSPATTASPSPASGGVGGGGGGGGAGTGGVGGGAESGGVGGGGVTVPFTGSPIPFALGLTLIFLGLGLVGAALWPRIATNRQVDA